MRRQACPRRVSGAMRIHLPRRDCRL